MRILLLDQYAEIGGAQRCLLDAAAGFAARGWDIRAVVPEGELSARLRPVCRSVEHIPCGPFHPGTKTVGDALRFFPQFTTQARAIRRLVRRGGFDVILVNGPRLMPAAALSHGGVPVVFHAHNVVAHPAAAAVLRASIQQCRASVIASSQFVARSLETAAAGRLRIVPNGVPSCAPPRSVRRPPPVIAVLGRIAPEKGQLEFVRAVRIVQQSVPCRAIIAGAPVFGSNAYSALVEQEARQVGIEWKGWIDDAPAFLTNIDLLVVPSDGIDATPRVVMEAFSAGTAVLAFASGGIPEMVRHLENGLLVEERSPQALARAVAGALSQPELLHALAQRASACWRELYRVELYQENLCAAIQQVADRRHQRNPLASTGLTAAT